MSTALPAAAGLPAAAPGTPPGSWRLVRATVPGLILGVIALWAIGIALSLTGLVYTAAGGGVSIFAPWVLDGPWSLAADAAWGALVCALLAAPVRERVRTRTGGAPISRVLTVASIAAGGYLPWLLTGASGARGALALLATPALLRAVAFERSGVPRRLPPALELGNRRLASLGAFGVLVLIAPFALLHAIAIDGTSQSGNARSTSSGFLISVAPGHVVVAQSALRAGLVPITVTAVTPLTNSRIVRIVRVRLELGAPLIPSGSRLALPVRVGARRSLWVGFALTLRRCPFGTQTGITRIRVRYRELGISLTETVPLERSNVFLTCP